MVQKSDPNKPEDEKENKVPKHKAKKSIQSASLGNSSKSTKGEGVTAYNFTSNGKKARIHQSAQFKVDKFRRINQKIEEQRQSYYNAKLPPGHQGNPFAGENSTMLG